MLSSEDARQNLLGSVAAQPPRPRNIPQASGQLVGRERELTELRRLLAEPDCRLLTLIGPGGNGKTRLALEAINEWLPERPGDNLAYVSLEALTSPTAFAASIARSLRWDQKVDEQGKFRTHNRVCVGQQGISLFRRPPRIVASWMLGILRR